MGKTRRIAERMILDRASRAHAIAQTLRNLAAQLEGHGPTGGEGLRPDDAARTLRESADQVERL
jgi:hypothetical protein